MHEPDTITESDLREAHQAAGTLASEEFRPYLPGRLLPVLLAKFRDDVAGRLGMDLPPLPQRPPARAAKLSELTSREFGILADAVNALVTRFTGCMDGPELPRLLREFRDAVLIDGAERTGIAREFAGKSATS